MKKKLFFTTLFSLFVTFGLLAQTDIYVQSSGDDTTGDGTSGNPYQTLHQAVIAATDGDNIIIVGAVSQTVTTTIGKNLTFTGNSNASVTITGTARLFIVNSAINLTFTDITFQNISSAGGSVLTTSGGASTTFTNCIFKNNSSSSGNGGALFIDGSNVTTTNCVFDSNSTTGGGGAIGLAGAGTFTATGSTFYNNSTANQGGAIRMMNTAEATITNCTFFGNNISKNSIVDGGAIRVNANGNILTVSNSLFYNNTSTTATEPNETDVNGVAGATINITNSLAQSTNNIDTTTGSNLTSDLTNSNLTWNATENRVEFTAPDNVSDDTPIDFGNDTEDVGAWDSKINIFKGGAAGAIESWVEPTNWSSGVIPIATDNVAILVGGACTLNTNATINDIKVTGRLDIRNTQALVINGTATGTGIINYLRNLTNDVSLTEAWHLVSSPLANEVFDTTFVTISDIAENGNNRGIASYNTADNTWSYLNTTTNTSINAVSGQGYSMKITPDGVTTGGERADGVVEFSGAFNTADVSTAVVTDGNGFNLLGNPYTAHINSATFLTDNTANLVSETIWLWNGNTYDTYVTADSFIVAPAQGFFVQASTNINLNFAESNQLETGGTFQKSSKSELKLLMTVGKRSRYTKLYFSDNATKGFDNGWDGETFGGIPNSLDVFTHLVEENKGKKYQIQSLPKSDMSSTVIPIGLVSEPGKELTFSIETVNFPLDTKVYLEDRLENKFTEISTSKTFKIKLTEASNDVGRFYLHTSKSVLSTKDVNLENVSIYASNKNTLTLVGLPDGESEVKLFNILGKQVLKTSFKANGIKEIALPNLTKGFYIVELNNLSVRLNKKIILE